MNFYRIIIIFLLVIISFGTVAQQKFTLSGTIADASNGEDLSGAVVAIQNTSFAALCNNYGFYSLSIPEGNYQMSVKLLGYETLVVSVELKENKTLNVSLKPISYELGNVEIHGTKSDQNVTSLDMGNVKITPKQAESIPVFFGERDLIKTIQLMPGVKQVGEGNTGFYVRGGGLDQNLILLDEAPVYNASHLLGFFSVFNSEAIREASLLKGSIPAEYGGRASSVLDIRMKEGDMDDYHATGSVGLISSNLCLEGPIRKDEGSFMVSARRTYADLFLNLASNEDIRTAKLYFYDLNLKANYRLNSSNRLFVSGYLGRDKFRMQDQFGFDWGSKTVTVRLNHMFSDKLFANSSLIYSNYSYEIDISGNKDVVMGSYIQDFNLKHDFSWYLNARNTLKFGFNVIFHKIVPGEVNAAPGSVYHSFEVRPRRAIESALYLSNSQQISRRLQLYYGLRMALFSNVGPGDFYHFDEQGTLVDSTSYNSFKWVKTQGGPEPRIALNYSLDSRSSLKASYNHIHQFVHLLSNTTSSTPTDVWLPTSDNVKPQIADQWSAGYFRNSANNVFESSVELYYKNLQNQIDYKNGADLVFNNTVEAELVYGKGWAYGAEFLLRKNLGRLTGWLGYTWSKTMRKFEQIDDGKPFPARQDRRHDVSVVAMYDLTHKLKISATWVYNSGNAVTFPEGKYVIDGRVVGYYTKRNGYRMPDYHRLDLGLTWIMRKTERFESSWNFSIYNAYGRENAYFISFRQKKDDPEVTEAVQISLFKIIPSVSYKFRF